MKHSGSIDRSPDTLYPFSASAVRCMHCKNTLDGKRPVYACPVCIVNRVPNNDELLCSAGCRTLHLMSHAG